jgi:hypothetical protein
VKFDEVDDDDEKRLIISDTPEPVFIVEDETLPIVTG